MIFYLGGVRIAFAGAVLSASMALAQQATVNTSESSAFEDASVDASVSAPATVAGDTADGIQEQERLRKIANRPVANTLPAPIASPNGPRSTANRTALLVDSNATTSVAKPMIQSSTGNLHIANAPTSSNRRQSETARAKNLKPATAKDRAFSFEDTPVVPETAILSSFASDATFQYDPGTTLDNSHTQKLAFSPWKKEPRKIDPEPIPEEAKEPLSLRIKKREQREMPGNRNLQRLSRTQKPKKDDY